jgi:hypothetical protein
MELEPVPINLWNIFIRVHPAGIESVILPIMSWAF